MGWGQRWKILISCRLTGASIFRGVSGDSWGNCLKRVAWIVCRFKGAGLSKKRGQCTYVTFKSEFPYPAFFELV